MVVSSAKRMSFSPLICSTIKIPSLGLMLGFRVRVQGSGFRVRVRTKARVRARVRG
jgi:hypothetical protein